MTRYKRPWFAKILTVLDPWTSLQVQCSAMKHEQNKYSNFPQKYFATENSSKQLVSWSSLTAES